MKLKPRHEIACACGCGGTLIDLDQKARSRIFIHGHNKGHRVPHSKEVIERLSRIKLGGKSSEETRKKQSISMKSAMVEGRHPSWKGGITPINEAIRKSVEYKLWREAVYQRDNFTCRSCGEKEAVSGKLNAHHIKPFSLYPELRFAIDNGETLCDECHKKTDTYLWKCPKQLN